MGQPFILINFSEHFTHDQINSQAGMKDRSYTHRDWCERAEDIGATFPSSAGGDLFLLGRPLFKNTGGMTNGSNIYIYMCVCIYINQERDTY